MKVLNLYDHGLGSYTDQREFKQGGGGLPVLALKMQLQKNGLMLREETDIAAVLTDTAIITRQRDPRRRARSGATRRATRRRTCGGGRGNARCARTSRACSREVYDGLAENPSILEAIKYTNLGSLTPELLARMFEVDELYIADGVVNTAEKGQAESISRIWGKDFVLGYHTKEPPSPLLDQPTCGYIVRLGDDLAADGMQNDQQRAAALVSRLRRAARSARRHGRRAPSSRRRRRASRPRSPEGHALPRQERDRVTRDE
jgi:hypothetical protein